MMIMCHFVAQVKIYFFICYVIIDYEYIVLALQIPYFIWTNKCERLTEEQIDRAISIFYRWL
jgi:hypothetical protein